MILYKNKPLRFIEDYRDGKIRLESIYFEYKEYCHKPDGSNPSDSGPPCDSIKSWSGMWESQTDPYFKIGQDSHKVIKLVMIKILYLMLISEIDLPQFTLDFETIY